MSASRLKELIRKKMPTVFRVFHSLRLFVHEILPTRFVFTRIYKNNEWQSSESVSGTGSEMHSTAIVRAAISEWVDAYGVKSMLDAPCGDYHWMRSLQLPVNYIGMDIVKNLITKLNKTDGNSHVKFIHGDLRSIELPVVDFLLCRDCLVHLPSADIQKVLLRVATSGIRWFASTSFPDCDRNEDIPVGYFRPINLQIAPFNLPAPIQIVDEKNNEELLQQVTKCLCLWSVEDLTVALNSNSIDS